MLLVTRRIDYGYFQPSWRIEAFDVVDVSLKWSRNAPGYESYAVGESSDSTPEPPAEGIAFSGRVTASQNTIILTMSNGHLWGIDAATGDDLWRFDSGQEWIDPPTIADSIAFSLVSGGLCAIRLDETPGIHWNADINEHNLRFLGVDSNFAWISGSESIIALNIESGNEYWKTPSDGLWKSIYDRWYGISHGKGLFQNGSADQLTAMDDTGSIAWSIDDHEYNDHQKVIVNDTISRFTPTSSNWDSCKIQCLSLDDGISRWDFDLFTDRWQSTDSAVVICDGLAYYPLYDEYEQQRVLVAVDPIAKTVHGIQGSNLTPEIVSRGVMFAIDRETNEIVCIGSIPGLLRVSGRATVIHSTTMYGAPNTSSADRGQVAAGEVLTITGDAETTQDGDWLPVTIIESGVNGWLPAEFMEGLDGGIIFEPIEVREFGILTSYQH